MPTTIVPRVIRFADENSVANYQKALAGTLNEYGFRPLIVINAAYPGTGKTTLARRILTARYGEAAVWPTPKTERCWSRIIPASLARRYLFIDDVIRTVRSATLCALLTSKEWSWREPRRPCLFRAKVDVQVILTGNNVQLSPDLNRLALWINLA